MATSKKTTKATSATAKTSVKKVAAKKSPTKKVVAAKSTTARKHRAKKAVASTKEMKSFKVAPEQYSFTSLQITRQTVYWVILVAFIIFVQLWILKLQIEVTTLINEQQMLLQSI